MDNAQKAIMIGVGLFITIIVIAAVMLITGIGQDMLNSGTNQLSGISEQMNTSVFASYNGARYNTPNTAIQAAKTIISAGGKVKVGTVDWDTTQTSSVASGNGKFLTGKKYIAQVDATDATLVVFTEN